MCEYFCIGFVHFIIQDKICYFKKYENKMIKIKKSIALFAVKIDILRTLEYHIFLKKG